MSVWGGLLLLLTAIATTLQVISHRLTLAYFRDPVAPPLPEPLPSVAILKPVEGAGPETYAAFASFCRLAWPVRYQLLIGTIRPDDPIVAVVERLRAEYPEQSIELVIAPLLGTNRKTSIMEALWRRADADLFFFSDADVTAPTDYLRQLVPRLAEPGVGCVTCLPRGTNAQTIGGRLIALHYAFGYLPEWMLALRTTGIDWAIGHTMAVPRPVLEALDGFTGFLDHLADDYELGHRAAGLGHRVVVPPRLLDCAMPAESPGAAYRRLLRWKRTIRRARGAQYAGLAFTWQTFWAATLVLTHAVQPWAWGIFAAVVALRQLLASQLARRIALPDWRRLRYWLPLLDLLEGLTFFGAWLGNTITWAGRRYHLRRDGTLEPLHGEAAE